MKRAPVFVAVLAAGVGLFAAGCGGGSGDVPSGSVAVVDGTEIPRSELDALVNQAKKSYDAGQQQFPKVGTPEYQQVQQQYVAFLVQKTEFEQEADELGIEIKESDIDKARADFLKSRSWNEKQLKDALEKEGLSEEGFRDTLRVSVLSQKIFDAVTKDVTVTDADALAYYTENKATTYPDTREVRHILISEKEKDGQVDYPKSKAEADRIYALLKDGGNFGALAKQYSDDPGSKSSGGKYTVKRGQTVPEFEAASFELKTGTISRPVKTQYGYHIIEPLADVKTVPFEQIKDVIKAQLLQEKKNAEMTTWVQDLQKRYKGKVSYATGFAPPEVPEPTETQTTETQ